MATKLKRNGTNSNRFTLGLDKKRQKNPRNRKKKEYCVRERKIVFLLVENKYKLYKFSSLIYSNLIRPGIVIKKNWRKMERVVDYTFLRISRKSPKSNVFISSYSTLYECSFTSTSSRKKQGNGFNKNKNLCTS